MFKQLGDERLSRRTPWAANIAVRRDVRDAGIGRARYQGFHSRRQASHPTSSAAFRTDRRRHAHHQGSLTHWSGCGSSLLARDVAALEEAALEGGLEALAEAAVLLSAPWASPQARRRLAAIAARQATSTR